MRMDDIISESEMKLKALLGADEKGICINLAF
jgi:hypothetical protein